MSLDQGSEKLDLADQEIPDRATAEAANWLREQVKEDTFDTPTFWLVAGLLAAFAEAERVRALEEAAKAVCSKCRDGNTRKQNGDHVWISKLSGAECRDKCIAAAIHELRREKGRG